MSVEVRIERLVLEGLSPAAGRRVGAALERELGALIAREGLPPAWGGTAEIRHLDAGAVERRTSTRSASFGRQLARQIHGGGRR